MPGFEIPAFTPQPEFPDVDLTDENARMLAVTLSNQIRVNEWHHAAETSVHVFRTLHPVIADKFPYRNHEAVKTQAVSHGMVVFEAINSAVTSIKPSTIDKSALQLTIMRPDVVNYFTNPLATGTMKERFCDQMPNAAAVLTEASERFFGGFEDYTLAGASVEREIILSAIALSGAIDNR